MCSQWEHLMENMEFTIVYLKKNVTHNCKSSTSFEVQLPKPGLYMSYHINAISLSKRQNFGTQCDNFWDIFKDRLDWPGTFFTLSANFRTCPLRAIFSEVYSVIFNHHHPHPYYCCTPSRRAQRSTSLLDAWPEKLGAQKRDDGVREDFVRPTSRVPFLFCTEPGHRAKRCPFVGTPFLPWERAECSRPSQLLVP